LRPSILILLHAAVLVNGNPIEGIQFLGVLLLTACSTISAAVYKTISPDDFLCRWPLLRFALECPQTRNGLSLLTPVPIAVLVTDSQYARVFACILDPIVYLLTGFSALRRRIGTLSADNPQLLLSEFYP